VTAGPYPGVRLQFLLAKNTARRPLKETKEGRALVDGWRCEYLASKAVDRETREVWLAKARQLRKEAQGDRFPSDEDVARLLKSAASFRKVEEYDRLAEQMSDPRDRDAYRQLAAKARQEAGVA